MTRAKGRRTDRSARQNRARPSAATASGEEVGAAGTLEVLPDGYGFLRRWEESLAGSVDDAYVARSLIDRFDLATGCEIQGISQAADGGRHGVRLKRVTTVNGLTPEEKQEVIRDIATDKPFWGQVGVAFLTGVIEGLADL